jgi:hypothetical protein
MTPTDWLAALAAFAAATFWLALLVPTCWYMILYCGHRAPTDAALVNQAKMNALMAEVQKSFHWQMTNNPQVPASVKLAYLSFVGTQEPNKGD